MLAPVNIVQSDPSSDLAGGRKVLFSAVKNEAPFLLEWIAYHKAIGFDDIVICSNPSTDGTEELLAALAAAGEIRHLRAKPRRGQSPQGLASAVFSKEIGYSDGNWYLWLDADEFLNVHVGDRTVDALLNELGPRRCVMINWRVFGSGGNRSFPGRFVSGAFSKASDMAFDSNMEVKTLFRRGDDFTGFALIGINRPIVRSGSAARPDIVATGTGLPPDLQVRRNRLWFNGKDSSKTSRVAPNEVGWALAQINHYIVRTEEFFALKRARGRGWAAGAVGAKNSRHTPEFFALHDRSDADDTTILHWELQTAAEMDRLRAIPAVSEAVMQSDLLVRQAVASLSEAAVNQVSEIAVTKKEPEEVFELSLPPTEAEYLRARYATVRNIVEYGSGGSTVVAASGGARVVSVESDKAWAERLSAHLQGISPTASVHYVDIGPTKDWGRPSTSRGAARYHRYALSVWDRPDLGDPDLVLIDGRFRAACLVAVMLRAKRPTTVLFDDYTPRAYYHAVERLAQKEETIGRMARFTVTPGPIPPDMLTQVIGWFADPR